MFLPVVLCGLSVAPMMARAQDDGTNGPPKVLVVTREMTKPGRGGMMHEKTEGAFLQALRANHVDDYYLAMTSMSGPDRALFLSGYPSFAAWEAANKSMYANPNPVAAGAIERANVADGDLLSETNQSVWARQDDLSLNPHDLLGDRYMEIVQYMVKPGHNAQWEELVKMVIAGYQKGVPDASWSMFRQVFGTSGDGYIVVIPLKSLAEFDAHRAHGKAFEDAMGKDGLKRLDELTASCIESRQTNLFTFSPAMSNPPEQWVKAEPDYWKPKKMMPAKKKEEMKPMQ
jgi:hypothetical protein